MDDGYGPSSLISWMHKEIQRSKLCNFLNVYNYDDDTVSNTGHQEQSKSKSVDSIHINCVIICNTVSRLV